MPRALAKLFLCPCRAGLADPTACAIWAALCTLEEGVKHQFLAELRCHLAIVERETPHRTRVARAVRLNEAHEVLLAEAREARRTAASSSPDPQPEPEPKLTEFAYAGLRLTHPEFRWMPPSTIRHTFGGQWNDALREARLDTVSSGEVITGYLGPSYEWEEVRDALRDYRDYLAERSAPDPEDFNLKGSYRWAKRPDILRRPGRRPRSQGPFDNFGGFLVAKTIAFAGDVPPTADAAEAAGLQWGAAGPYRYSDEQLIAAVHEIAARLGRAPRALEFRKEQRLMHAEEAARGLPRRAVPTDGTVLKRWKLWDAVLVACGYEPHRPIEVDPDTGAARPNGPRPHIPDEVLLAGIVEAFEAKGKPFTMKVYGAYVTERGRASRSGQRLATYHCIHARYRGAPEGPWRHACDKVLLSGWDQLDP